MFMRFQLSDNKVYIIGHIVKYIKTIQKGEGIYEEKRVQFCRD